MQKSKRLESDLGAQEAQQRSEYTDSKTEAVRVKEQVCVDVCVRTVRVLDSKHPHFLREPLQILALTQENTTLLRAIGELTAQQLQLERELNTQATTGVNVGDSEPFAKQESEERERLMQASTATR